MTPSQHPSAAIADRVAKKRRSGTVNEVVCGYCRGTGKDPFGVMSPLSTCQVCGGSGHGKVHPPTERCKFCGGSGVHPGSRQTCLACKGVGVVEAHAGRDVCPDCGGGGKAGVFYCPTCRGQGRR